MFLNYLLSSNLEKRADEERDAVELPFGTITASKKAASFDYLNELLNGTEKSAVAAIPPLVSAYPPGLEPPPHGSIGKTLAGAGIGAGAGGILGGAEGGAVGLPLGAGVGLLRGLLSKKKLSDTILHDALIGGGVGAAGGGLLGLAGGGILGGAMANQTKPPQLIPIMAKNSSFDVDAWLAKQAGADEWITDMLGSRDIYRNELKPDARYHHMRNIQHTEGIGAGIAGGAGAGALAGGGLGLVRALMKKDPKFRDYVANILGGGIIGGGLGGVGGGFAGGALADRMPLSYSDGSNR